MGRISQNYVNRRSEKRKTGKSAIDIAIHRFGNVYPICATYEINGFFFCNTTARLCVIINSMLPELTDERALTLDMIGGLAPDHATWRAAEALAASDKWARRGATATVDGHLLWAAFPEGKRPDTQTLVHLPTFHVRCACAAARFPCRHVVALLLRHLADPPVPEPAPSWASAWRAVEERAARPSAADEAADARRLSTLVAGLADLARWLDDQARQGLADLPRQGRAAWLAAANRLVDAQAPAAARELRELAALPGSGPDWPERLLPRLGLLALLAESFARLNSLSPAARGDVLTAAGWPPRPGDDRVVDEWLIVGRRQEVDGKQRHLRTWLRGLSSGRWALLEELRPARRIEGTWRPTGATTHAELAFLPGAAPLAAQPLAPLTVRVVAGVQVTGEDVADAIAGYAAARAANPWQRHYPFLLAGVRVEPAPGGWRLRDRAGRLLPLPERFGGGWQLLALAADRPLTLFGEWDGRVLTPLSVFHDGWRDMASWKGLA